MAFSRKNQTKKALKMLKRRYEIYKNHGIQNHKEGLDVKRRIDRTFKRLHPNV